MELIICGTQYLDFHELEKSAKYEDGYEKDSLTCKQFWEVLHELNEEEKKKFLFFVTGCDRAPINGLGSLVIIISRFGPDQTAVSRRGKASLTLRFASANPSAKRSQQTG